MDPYFLYLKKRNLSTNIFKHRNSHEIPSSSILVLILNQKFKDTTTRPTFLNPHNSLTTNPLPPSSINPDHSSLALERCGTADSPCSCFGKRGARPDRGWTPREEKKVSISPWTKIAPRHARPSVSYRHASIRPRLRRPPHLSFFHEMESFAGGRCTTLAQRRLCSFYLV